VPRHAWWRVERDDVATTGALTGDMAGSAAPPILARQDLDADRRPASIAIERELLSVRIGSDTTMDPDFASQLNGTCSSDPNAFAFLDPSPMGFDNAFYRNLQVGKGLLGSDQMIYSDIIFLIF